MTGAADGTLRVWQPGADDALWEAWLTDPRPLATEAAAERLHLQALQGHRASVNQCAFTPDGRQLISASSDGTLRMWDAYSGAPAGVLAGHLDDVNGFDISASGRRLASVSGDGGILVWRLPEGRIELAVHVDGPLAAITWVQEQRLVAVGARGVYLFDCPGA